MKMQEEQQGSLFQMWGQGERGRDLPFIKLVRDLSTRESPSVMRIDELSEELRYRAALFDRRGRVSANFGHALSKQEIIQSSIIYPPGQGEEIYVQLNRNATRVARGY